MWRESPSQLGDSGWSSAIGLGGPIAPPPWSTLIDQSLPSVTNTISVPFGDHTGPLS